MMKMPTTTVSRPTMTWGTPGCMGALIGASARFSKGGSANLEHDLAERRAGLEDAVGFLGFPEGQHAVHDRAELARADVLEHRKERGFRAHRRAAHLNL